MGVPVTQPIQGRATIRFEADTSRIIGEVLAATRQAVAAAEQVVQQQLAGTTAALAELTQIDTAPLLGSINEAIAEAGRLQQATPDVVLDADPQPLLDAVAEAAAAVEQLDGLTPKVTIGGDSDPLQEELDRISRELPQSQDREFRLIGNARPLLEAAAEAAAALGQIESGADAIVLDSDPGPLLDAVHAAMQAVSDLEAASTRVEFEGDPTPILEEIARIQAAISLLAADADQVALGADPTELLEQLQDAQEALDALRARGPVVELGADAGPVVAEVERAADAVDGLGGRLGGLRAGFDAALAVGTGALAALGTAAITAGGAFNILSQGVNQGLTAVLQSRDAARELVDEVIELNQTAPFSRQVFLQATQQLVGYGVAAEQVTRTLDAMQQAVVAVGGGEEEFLRLTNILAEVESQGRATGDTVARLGDMGINLSALIAEVTGESVSAVREAIAAGQVGLEEITQALSTRYAGAVAGYAQLWAGAMGSVMAGLRNIGSALLEPLIDLERGGYGVDVLNALAGVLRALNRQAGPLADVLDRRLAPGVERLTAGLDRLAERIDGADLDALISTAQEGAPAFAAMAAALSTMGSAALLSAIPGLGGLAGVLNPAVAALAAAAAASPELRAELVELVTAVQPLAATLIEVTALLATFATTGVGVLVDAAAPAVDILTALVDAFDRLPGPVQQATIAVTAFWAAMRTAGPVGVTIAAVTALGAAVEALEQIFGQGRNEADRMRAGMNLLAEDLERFGRTGRVDTGIQSVLDDLQDLSDAIEAQTGEVGFWAGTWEHAWRALTGQDQRGRYEVSDILAEYRERFVDLDQQLAALVAGGNVDAAEAAFERFAERVAESGISQEQLMELLPGYARELERAADRADDAAGAQERLATSTERVTEALRAHHDELRAQADPLFALNRALREVEEAQAAYDEAIKESGEGSPAARDAALELADAVLQVNSAALEASGVLTDDFVRSMIASLEAAGVAQPAIEAVEAALRGVAEEGAAIEDEYTTRVVLRGADTAVAQAEMVRRRLEDIDRFIEINFSVTGQAPIGSINLPTFADGGVINAATVAVVGEAGPEVVLPLTRAERMTTLLANPVVWGPVSEAMGKVVRRRPQLSPLDVLVAAGTWAPPTSTSLAAGGGGGGVVRGGDDPLISQVAAMRDELAALRGVLASARPITIHQVPGESAEQLVRRVEARLNPGW